VLAAAEKLYDELRASETAVDVLLDDREVSPGVKFKDADLIGFPLRVVVGERGLKQGQVEVKWRHEPDAVQVPLEGACRHVVDSIEQARQLPKS
jgi:prolyl-tRNA synthetase